LIFKLLYTKEAAKQISKFDHSVKDRIRVALERLSFHPELGKPLTGFLAGRFSYRVGNYRIIYKILKHEVVVLVLTVGHRREVYG